MPALPILRSINALVMSVVAWTIGAVMSAGWTPALSSTSRTPRRTPSSGAAGVVSVLSTTTRPDAASSSTTSVNVPPMSTASRQSASLIRRPFRVPRARWREDVEDPDLAVLVVADEDAVAMPDAAWGEVDVASIEHLARVILASPMRKSSVPRMMMPSCSFSSWRWRNEPSRRRRCARTTARVVADDHSPTEAGSVGLDELVLVEEVAVAVVGLRAHSPQALHHAPLDILEVAHRRRAGALAVAVGDGRRRSPGGRRRPTR